MKIRTITCGALLVLLWASGATTQAQEVAAARTYISTAGSDSNACSLAAPCRNFSAAVSKTASHGEITALDSGNYGNVTVNRAVTLQAAPGVLAALGTLSRTTPVVITASEADTVVLRNLQITRAGFSNATRGVEFNTGGALHVENCVIAGFSETGLRFAPAGVNSTPGGPRLFVKNTVVRNNGTGIYLTSVYASINHSSIEDNGKGVWAAGQVQAFIGNTEMSGNSGAGLEVNYSCRVDLEQCIVARNQIGIKVYDGGVSASRSAIEGLENHNGSMISYGNNRLSGGSFTSTLSER